MVGVSLVPNIMLEEKDTKTLDALLVSPAKPVHIVLGKAATGLFYCLSGMAVAYAFNLALINQWWLAILAGVSGSAFTVALGLLVGSTIGNRAQLMLWAWVLLIPLLVPTFLSVMKDVLPAGLLSAFQWIPTVALSKVLRLSFSNRAPLATFGPELALIAVWTLLVLVAVIWVVRRSDRV
jgi:ABC-2 type transport system permease protein